MSKKSYTFTRYRQCWMKCNECGAVEEVWLEPFKGGAWVGDRRVKFGCYDCAKCGGRLGRITKCGKWVIDVPRGCLIGMMERTA